jgi:hypothetical protein
MNTHESAAKKIANIFSDARYTKADLDKIAMLTVILSREPLIHDRVEYFSERFMFHRETMEFGREMDETFVVKDLFSDTFPGKMGA